MRATPLLPILGLAGILFCGPATAAGPAAADAPTLHVAAMTVCRDVDGATRTAVAPADTFPADVERLACLTRITGAADTTTVVHVWLHRGKPLARVPLPVRSPDWRTWSRKRILPAWTGPWEVMVLDADGGVLARRAFVVVPAAAAGNGAGDGAGARP